MSPSTKIVISQPVEFLVKLRESLRAFTYDSVKHFATDAQVEAWRPELGQRIAWSSIVPFLGVELTGGMRKSSGASASEDALTCQLYYIEAWQTNEPSLHQIAVLDALKHYLITQVTNDIGEVVEITDWLYAAEPVVFRSNLDALSIDYCAAMITFRIAPYLEAND